MMRWLEIIGAAAIAFFGALGWTWARKAQQKRDEDAAFARRQQETVDRINAHLAKTDRASEIIADQETAAVLVEGTKLATGDHLTELLEEADKITRARAASSAGPGNAVGAGGAPNPPPAPAGPKEEP